MDIFDFSIPCSVCSASRREQKPTRTYTVSVIQQTWRKRTNWSRRDKAFDSVTTPVSDAFQFLFLPFLSLFPSSPFVVVPNRLFVAWFLFSVQTRRTLYLRTHSYFLFSFFPFFSLPYPVFILFQLFLLVHVIHFVDVRLLFSACSQRRVLKRWKLVSTIDRRK